MLKIFAKILLLVIPSVIAVVITANNYTDGYIDVHYRKIEGEGRSLIIGTSRASQGIVPEIVMAGTSFDEPMLNYAFTSFNSPYTENYYRAIEKKLDPAVKNGIFILEVDPFAFTEYKEAKDAATSKLFSQQLIFNGSPNYEYLYRNINPFYTLIARGNGINPYCTAHKNGWLEISLSEDSIESRERAMAKLTANQKEADISEISAERVQWLEKTISLLKQHGKVILVRIPAWQPIIDAENVSFKDLNQIITKVCKDNDVQYFNFTHLNTKYNYVDGNHLKTESGKLFSKELNHLILSL